MKDAVATMGNVLPDDAGGRDAVHVAVFSATSAERLFPGQDISIAKQEEADAVVTSQGEPVAIVDPFLRHSVEPGIRFWAYLYPRTITALSHRWSHPAFEATTSAYLPPASMLARQAAELWLRDFCAHADCPDYDTIIYATTKIASGQTEEWDEEKYNGWSFDGSSFHFGGTDAHSEIPPEFWGYIETVVGRAINGSKPTYFSCSC